MVPIWKPALARRECRRVPTRASRDRWYRAAVFLGKIHKERDVFFSSVMHHELMERANPALHRVHRIDLSCLEWFRQPGCKS